MLRSATAKEAASVNNHDDIMQLVRNHKEAVGEEAISESRERLILAFVGYVYTIAKNMDRAKMDDLASVGLMELVRCVDRFREIGRDYDIKPYLSCCVKRRMLSECIESRNVIWQPKETKEKVEVFGGLEDDNHVVDHESPELRLMIREVCDLVLSCAERRILMMYMSGWTLREIGEEEGRSLSSIGAIKSEALSKVRDYWLFGIKRSGVTYGSLSRNCIATERRCYQVGGCRPCVPRDGSRRAASESSLALSTNRKVGESRDGVRPCVD